MNQNQREAISRLKGKHAEAMESSVNDFFSYLQRSIITQGELECVQRETTSKGQIILMLENLVQKEESWETILKYLCKSRRIALASQLIQEAGEPPDTLERYMTQNVTLVDSQTLVKSSTFITSLIDFYKFAYIKVKDGSKKSKKVNKVWVSIKMKEIPFEPSSQTASLRYLKMLEHLGDSRKSILIKAGPGAGKTTLIKRIAYDWLKQRESNIFSSDRKIKKIIPDPIELVLSVSLESFKYHENSMMSMALYFINALSFYNMNPSELASHFTQLGSKLLICLDGLDECPDSVKFLHNLFNPTSIIQRDNPYFTQRIIATSRYCPDYDTISSEYFGDFKLEISDLNASDRDKLKQRYGVLGRKHTVDSLISDYSSNRLVVSIACHLASKKMKVTKTDLFDAWQKELLWRKCEHKRSEAERKKDEHWEKWRESREVMVTTKLAYDGCRERIYNFQPSQVDPLCYCFLVHDTKDKLAKFEHNSVQQYFAALHCYQMIFSDDSRIQKSALEQIFFGTGEIGRFFFGICSKENKFNEMLAFGSCSDLIVDILSPMGFGLNYKIFLSKCFTDCTQQQRQKIEKLLDTSTPNSSKNRLKLNKALLAQPDYPNGNIEWVNEKQIACVSSIIPHEFKDSYQETSCVMWRFGFKLSGEYVDQILLQIDKFPNLKNVYLTEIDGDYEVLIRICHLCNCTTCAIQLTSFNFRFYGFQASELRKIGSQANWIKQVSETTGKIDNVYVIWSMVNFDHIEENVSLKDFAACLIKFALDLFYKKGKDYEKKNQSTAL